MIRAYENHWFPLIRPAIYHPYFWVGWPAINVEMPSFGLKKPSGRDAAWAHPSSNRWNRTCTLATWQCPRLPNTESDGIFWTLKTYLKHLLRRYYWKTRGVDDFSMGIRPERKASQVELMIKTHPGFGCSIPRHPRPPPEKVSFGPQPHLLRRKAFRASFHTSKPKVFGGFWKTRVYWGL